VATDLAPAPRARLTEVSSTGGGAAPGRRTSTVATVAAARAAGPRPTGGRVVVAARGVVRLVLWCAGLAVTLVVLHRLVVPGADLGAIDLASRDPADLLPVLLRGARGVALACAWYLAAVTALSMVSSLIAWGPLRRFERAVTVPAVRRLVRAGLSATLAVGVGLGPSVAAAAAPGPPGAGGRPAPLAELDDRPATSEPGSTGAGVGLGPPGAARGPAGTSAGPDADVPLDLGGVTSADVADDLVTERPGGADLEVPPPQVAPPADGVGSHGSVDAPERRPPDGPERSAARGSLRSVGPPGAGGTPAPPVAVDDTRRMPATSAPAASAPAASAPAASAPAERADDEAPNADVVDATGTHVVVAGESFWSIAADLTAAELGRDPDDTEVFERWTALIERNQDRLLVPGDPDLLLPGQELQLPGGGR
jgi:hypothetical protein